MTNIAASGTSEIAVIVPALDEGDRIAATLAAIGPGVTVIVTDGSSRDRTQAIAAEAGALVLTVSGGRAAQMNAGAAACRAPLLLFLHADTRLPDGWQAMVRAILADPAVALGAFRLAIDGASTAEKWIAAGANARSRWWGVPYGDQALFLRRGTFESLGGFPRQPIMEDWSLARAARRLGRITLAPAAVTTSPRRWRALGVWRTFWINQLMLAGARLGVPFPALARFYRRRLDIRREIQGEAARQVVEERP